MASAERAAATRETLHVNGMEKRVTQDNTLIEAKYFLSLNEQKLLKLCFARVDPRPGVPGTNGFVPIEMEVTAEAWKNAYGGGDNAYRDLKAVTERLFQRHVELNIDDGGVKKFRWVDSVEYFDGQGRVVIRPSVTLQMRIKTLFESFTSYELAAVRGLSSFHSWRLYELLAQFRSTGLRRITVDDFRWAMDCVKKYKVFGDLERQVIKPAMDDVNKSTDIRITGYGKKRKGRRIGMLEFHFEENKAFVDGGLGIGVGM